MSNPLHNFNRADVPAKINTGLGGEGAGLSFDETERRLVEASVVAAPTPATVGSGTPGAAAKLPVAPPVKPVPDRHHKESGNQYGAYVILSPDHGVEDMDTPTNSGYRSPNLTASSLNDAYTKALSLAAGFHGKANSRVCIEVKGGQWIGDLNCTSDVIDLVGVGRPIIYGHVTVAPTATAFRMSNFHAISPDSREAVHVTPSPLMPAGVSPVKFFDVWFSGPMRGFWAERKVLLYGCEGWQDADNTGTGEATMTFSSAVDDNDFSIARFCNFRAFTGLDTSIPGVLPPGARTFKGLAICATGKTAGYVLPYLDTDLGYLRPMSGLKLEHCTVEGSLLCEGWVVLHKHCDVYAGLPTLTVNGGFYAKITGYWFGPKLLNGIVQFDDTTVHAGHIAEFFPDVAQSLPNACGGIVHFRKLTHLNGVGAVAATTCVNNAATALVYHDKLSSTASAHWLGAGGTSTPDDTTGCALPVDVMFDPYTL